MNTAAPHIHLYVPRHALPDDKHQRASILKGYFCETISNAELIPSGWRLILSRPTDADYYVDSNLHEGLNWWSKEFGHTDVNGIPFTFNRQSCLQISLEDSWTIYSWSRWLTQNSTRLNEAVTLLHIDDHDDMMSPRLDARNDAWIDLISRETFDLLNSGSVKAAIISGAVGIGSFMAPLIHFLPNVQVRHLCNTEYSFQRLGQHQIQAVFAPDTLLEPSALRPALTINGIFGQENELTGCPYQVTNDLSKWLEDIPNGPVLLHIDMDYFNNRFNGDSDWTLYGAKHDPTLSQVLTQIDLIFEALRSKAVYNRIDDITIALSPGFFPAEMWEKAIERIKDHLIDYKGSGHESS